MRILSHKCRRLKELNRFLRAALYLKPRIETAAVC